MYGLKMLDRQILTDEVKEAVDVRQFIDAVHRIATPAAVVGEILTVETDHVVYFFGAGIDFALVFGVYLIVTQDAQTFILSAGAILNVL